MRGVGEMREEGERAVMQLGTNLLLFIRLSVNRVVFARTGTQGSVEESARREIRRMGIASCPGLHFAVIICTNSARRAGESGQQGAGTG